MMALMITWTDVFYGIGDFFLWFFKCMPVLWHFPNFIFGVLIIGCIVYWTMRLRRYNREAQRNSTIE